MLLDCAGVHGPDDGVPVFLRETLWQGKRNTDSRIAVLLFILGKSSPAGQAFRRNIARQAELERVETGARGYGGQKQRERLRS